MSRATCDGERGFTVLELLVASAVAIVVMASVFRVLHPAQGIFTGQPEAGDMQQRLRVAIDVLTKDLVMAGAGPDTGRSAGPLVGHIAAVLPYRTGLTGSDPVAGRFFRNDAITLLYVPSTAAQTTLREPLARDSHEVQLSPQPNCPPDGAVRVCGFEARMRALILDTRDGAWDVVTISAIQAPVVQIEYGGTLSKAYPAGASVSEVVSRTYYLKSDDPTGTYQLMQYDGYLTDLPVVDHVVRLEFTYFGQWRPPMLLPGNAPGDPPVTTYGPAPPDIGRDNHADSWPPGENCLFLVDDDHHIPRLPMLPGGPGAIALEPGILTDGPWCTDGAHGNRFDADLLRVRRVRVRVRVQAAAASLRGPAGVLFTRAGTGTTGYWVPDQELSFDVTPRNLSLERWP